ncbi:MAG: rhodanese-like domain-containing protein [Ilumatobacteraceae bacterium]
MLDVRSPEEYGAGSVPGAINVPLDELRSRLGEVPDGPVVTLCAVGQRGHAAASSLQRQGRTVANLSGGYTTWINAMQSVPEPAI